MIMGSFNQKRIDHQISWDHYFSWLKDVVAHSDGAPSLFEFKAKGYDPSLKSWVCDPCLSLKCSAASNYCASKCWAAVASDGWIWISPWIGFATRTYSLAWFWSLTDSGSVKRPLAVEMSFLASLGTSCADCNFTCAFIVVAVGIFAWGVVAVAAGALDNAHFSSVDAPSSLSPSAL